MAAATLFQDGTYAMTNMICCVYIFTLLFSIVALAIQLYMAYWVYKDAESKGQNGVLWLLLVIVANIWGFIIYLVVRGSFDKESSHLSGSGRGYGPGPRSAYVERARRPNTAGVTRTCFSCTREIPGDSNLCPYCGHRP